MRGAQREPFWCDRIPGIIPADAGSTILQAVKPIKEKDHPRGCGEHMNQTGLGTRMMGSSPRMRGALAGADADHPEYGIIPADAGSTVSGNVHLRGSRDHPRGCGEHDDEITVAQKRAGSSPRMRGALFPTPDSCTIPRIIPADAGSTPNKDDDDGA